MKLFCGTTKYSTLIQAEFHFKTYYDLLFYGVEVTHSSPITHIVQNFLLRDDFDWIFLSHILVGSAVENLL